MTRQATPHAPPLAPAEPMGIPASARARHLTRSQAMALATVARHVFFSRPEGWRNKNRELVLSVTVDALITAGFVEIRHGVVRTLYGHETRTRTLALTPAGREALAELKAEERT